MTYAHSRHCNIIDPLLHYNNTERYSHEGAIRGLAIRLLLRPHRRWGRRGVSKAMGVCMRSISCAGWWCASASCAVRTVYRPAAAVGTPVRSGLAVVATVTPAGCAQSFVFTDSPASLAVTRGALVWLLATAMAVLGAAEVFAAPRHKPVSAQLDKATGADRHKPVPAHGRKAAKTPRHEHGATPKRSAAARQSERRRAAQTAVPNIPLPRPRPAVATLPSDLAAAKQAIELVRQGKPSEATTLARSIGDPVAQTLVEWALLRHAESTAGFTRYAAFIRANPEWPGIQRLRRRAEARLWQERRDATIVRRFIGATPTSGVGRLARARAVCGGRPRWRRARSARGMAVGAALGRSGGCGARCIRRRAGPLRP
jgi:hypothetical protein